MNTDSKSNNVSVKFPTNSDTVPAGSLGSTSYLCTACGQYVNYGFAHFCPNSSTYWYSGVSLADPKLLDVLGRIAASLEKISAKFPQEQSACGHDHHYEKESNAQGTVLKDKVEIEAVPI